MEEIVKIKKCMQELREELNKLMDKIDSCDKERLLVISKKLDKDAQKTLLKNLLE